MASVLVIAGDGKEGEEIAKRLRSRGHEVRVEVDGGEALRALADARADVVLADVLLPGVSGLRLVSEVGKLFPAAKVVLMSGRANEQISSRALVAGAYAFVAKPLEENALAKLVDNASAECGLTRDKRRLEDEKSYLAAIIDSSNEAIMSTDLDGQIVSWNKASERIYGYAAEEVLGTPVESLAPSEHDHERTTKVIRDIHEKNSIHVGHDTVHIRKDGRKFDVSVKISPIRDRHANLLGFSRIVSDITQRKKAERKLHEAVKELSRSNQQLERFASTAAHDLKAPLNAIQTVIEWMEEDMGDVPPEIGEHLEMLRGQIDRMRSLLDSLLQFARAGRNDHAVEEVDTARLVREIVTMLPVPAGFSIEVAPDLPTFPTMRVPLQQVLQNLIANALVHHDRGEGTIRVGALVNKHHVEFSVSDDGPGIPEQFHERVFEVFQRLKPRDEAEGSGMGLAIVRKSVELAGGKVWIESGEGRGANFRFTWPMEWKRG